ITVTEDKSADAEIGPMKKIPKPFFGGRLGFTQIRELAKFILTNRSNFNVATITYVRDFRKLKNSSLFAYEIDYKIMSCHFNKSNGKIQSIGNYVRENLSFDISRNLGNCTDMSKA
ncbi:3089_t:CDS:2, partial [Dentiscutata heterogama]